MNPSPAPSHSNRQSPLDFSVSVPVQLTTFRQESLLEALFPPSSKEDIGLRMKALGYPLYCRRWRELGCEVPLAATPEDNFSSHSLFDELIYPARSKGSQHDGLIQFSSQERYEITEKGKKRLHQLRTSPQSTLSDEQKMILGMLSVCAPPRGVRELASRIAVAERKLDRWAKEEATEIDKCRAEAVPFLVRAGFVSTQKIKSLDHMVFQMSERAHAELARLPKEGFTMNEGNKIGRMPKLAAYVWLSIKTSTQFDRLRGVNRALDGLNLIKRDSSDREIARKASSLIRKLEGVVTDDHTVAQARAIERARQSAAKDTITLLQELGAYEPYYREHRDYGEGRWITSFHTPFGV